MTKNGAVNVSSVTERSSHEEEKTEPGKKTSNERRDPCSQGIEDTELHSISSVASIRPSDLPLQKEAEKSSSAESHSLAEEDTLSSSPLPHAAPEQAEKHLAKEHIGWRFPSAASTENVGEVFPLPPFSSVREVSGVPLSVAPIGTNATLAAPSPPPASVFTLKGRGTFNACLRMEAREEEGTCLATPFSNTLSSHDKSSIPSDNTFGRGPRREANPISMHKEPGISQGPEGIKGARTTAPSVNGLRKGFGEAREIALSLNFLLFSGEKRKRTYMMVGHMPLLQSCLLIKELPFFGRKPLQFAKKPLRLLQMVIERPPPCSTSGEKGRSEEDEARTTREDFSAERRIHKGPVLGEENQPTSAQETTTVESVRSASVSASFRAASQSDRDSTVGTPGEPASPSLPAEKPQDPSWCDNSTLDVDEVEEDEVYHLRTLHDVLGVHERAAAPQDNSMGCHPTRSHLTKSGLRAVGENSLSRNHGFLTTRRMPALINFLKKEMADFLTLEDVRSCAASVRLFAGSAYGCSRQRSQLLSHGSMSESRHPTYRLSEFVEDVGDESRDIYFIRENPECVTQAIQAICGASNDHSSLSFVKITLLSDEGQRTHTRAAWSELDQSFYVYSTETQGASLHWTVFPMEDEHVQGFLSSSAASCTSSTANPSSSPRQDAFICYPFEVEMRAFHRWKEIKDHPSRPLIDCILHHLTNAEQKAVREGYAQAYSEIPTDQICRFASSSQCGFHIEMIAMERIMRRRIPCTEVIVDTANALIFENFGASRRYGTGNRREEEKLAVRHSTSTSVHWKLDPRQSPMQNAAHLKDAMELMHKCLVKANDFQHSPETSSKGIWRTREQKRRFPLDGIRKWN